MADVSHHRRINSNRKSTFCPFSLELIWKNYRFGIFMNLVNNALMRLRVDGYFSKHALVEILGLKTKKNCYVCVWPKKQIVKKIDYSLEIQEQNYYLVLWSDEIKNNHLYICKSVETCKSENMWQHHVVWVF